MLKNGIAGSCGYYMFSFLRNSQLGLFLKTQNASTYVCINHICIQTYVRSNGYSERTTHRNYFGVTDGIDMRRGKSVLGIIKGNDSFSLEGPHIHILFAKYF